MTYPQNNPKSPYLLRLLQLCRHIWIWSGSEVKPEQNRSDSGMNPERMELPRMGWGGGGVMSTGGADEDFGGSLGVTLTSPSAPCPRSEGGGEAGRAGLAGREGGPSPASVPVSSSSSSSPSFPSAAAAARSSLPARSAGRGARRGGGSGTSGRSWRHDGERTLENHGRSLAT